MTLTPLMPMATAVWLVENTTLTFKQIADFCNLHEVEVQGIADGEVANGPDEFVEQIKREVVEIEEKGNDFKWNTDYAFSLAVTTGEGDWVNAQFTSTHTNPDSELEAEVFYEFYHIIDGKVQEWNQFKRTELK